MKKRKKEIRYIDVDNPKYTTYNDSETIYSNSQFKFSPKRQPRKIRRKDKKTWKKER